MVNRQYIATVHKDKDSDYGVQFYNFLGCISSVGETIEEAQIMATEALNGHIEFMLEDGDSIPNPSPLEIIILDDDYKDAITSLMCHCVIAFLVINVAIDITENNFVLS